jgi:competence protein ComEC
VVTAIAVAFTAGVGLLQIQASVPPLGWACALIAPGLLAALPPCRSRSARALRASAQLAAAFGCGFFWAALAATVRLADELPAAWEGRDIRVSGVIAHLPQAFDRGVRFELDVEAFAPQEARVPARIVLSWYGSWRRNVPAALLPVVHAGERWELTVRLKRPHGTSNPHGFDYEAWLFERGVRATGYVRIDDAPQHLDALAQRPAYWLERLRERIRARILDALDGQSYAGVIAALVMGDQRQIPQAQWTVFTRTGVNHLMSISGLHVTMIGALALALVHSSWRLSARLCLWLPARRAAVAAAFLAALTYAALAGFAVPAQRTVYMLAVVSIALWLGRVCAPATVLALALLVVVVLDPWAVLAPGFWLSFGAVGVILYTCTGYVRSSHWLGTWARTQWAVTIGLIPLLLAMYQQISVVSPLANALAIPLVSLAIVPIAIAGTALAFDWILAVAHALMAVLMMLLEALASAPDAVWQQHAPVSWAVIVALCGICWILLPRGIPARWLGLIAILPLFLVVPAGPRFGEMRIAVLDVGQGLAVVVRTQHHALVYDAGPLYSADADSGSRIVVPYLRATGIRRLSGIVVTHADNDHSGGVAAVFAAVPFDWMLSSLPESSELHRVARISIPCHAGQRWEWDGVRFELLHPPIETYDIERMKANDRSCVLRIDSPAARVLLTGDVEARSERSMLARDPHTLRADILVAPHHGSTTSSTDPFVAAVLPAITIFAVGYRNRFGHPRTEVVRRYRDVGSRIVRSDRDGAILLEIATDGVRIELQRERYRRYWHDPPTRGGASLDDL